jgi:hypothetical protein
MPARELMRLIVGELLHGILDALEVGHFFRWN